MMSPPLQYHILQAAGLAEPSHSLDEIMGQISLKHAFEIAKFHAQDEWYVSRDYAEKDIVHLVVQEARKIGVQVVTNDLIPAEYKRFRENAQNLKASYLQRKAQEEKDRLEELRRKSAEARKAAADGMS